MKSLVTDLLAGRRRALARMLTIIENERPEMHEALAALYPHTGKAWIIGVTGAPGTGKSSLVNALARAYRACEQSVGIIAVDPSSPFTGGALLGDRIRMQDLSGDPGVFIRSMATRGSLGGLASTTRDAVRAFDAAGFDVIIIETVGAGQSEVDIVRTAHTTIVVEAPGLGDDVQAIKAGILEIADVLVVNKADHIGANKTVRALRAMLELGHPSSHWAGHHRHTQTADHSDEVPAENNNAPMWVPPVIKTIATESSGLDELKDAVEAHRQHTTSTGGLAARQTYYLRLELTERLQSALMQRLRENLSEAIMDDLVRRIHLRELDPHSAVQQLLAHDELQ